jgi:hypothetical protein
MFAGIGFSRLEIIKSILIVEAGIGINVFKLPLVVSVLIVLLEFGAKPFTFLRFALHVNGEINGCIVLLTFVSNLYCTVIKACVGKDRGEFFCQCSIYGVCPFVYKFCTMRGEAGIACASDFK